MPPPHKNIPTDAILVFFLSIPPYQSDLLLRILPHLDRGSRGRALTIGDPDSRWQFCCAHYLRHTVSRRYGHEDAVIAHSPAGKPVLQAADGTVALHISLSHARGMVACAIARRFDLGLDLEWLDRRADLAPLVGQFFNDGERVVLQSMPEHARTQMIYHIWTIKEAILKAMGTGLSHDPKTITITGTHPVAQAHGIGPNLQYFTALHNTPHHVLCVATPIIFDKVPSVQWHEAEWQGDNIIFN